MNATHNPMPIASIRSQWPVRTHMHTIETDSENETSSAGEKRPHTHNDILWTKSAI